MVTSIPTENELYSLQRKIKKWYSQEEPSKQTNYIYQNVINYFNLCQKYYLYKNSLNNLIKLFYKSKQTFYNWAKKIQLCLKEKLNFIVLAKKSTRPININNNYSKTYKIAVAKMMKKYRQKYGTGIYEFFNLTLAGFFRYKKKVIKHNIKTLIKWNKEFNNFYPKNKKIRTYKSYEMSELGHLQHDIKILTPNMTGFKRNLYLYDFIDEKSRFGLAYLSENKSQSSAIGIFNQAYDDFLNNKIKIKRIRTDNGPEYVYSYNPEYKYHKSEFTKVLHQKGVIHQTTPIRSPQSNGKIERFHQNWNKFFEYLPRYPKNINELRKLITIFLDYYNNVRLHKSINFLTPSEAVLKFLKD